MERVISKIRSSLIFLVVILLLVVSSMGMYQLYLKEHRNAKRLSENNRVLNEQFMVNDSTFAAKTQAYRITLSEFRDANAQTRTGYAKEVVKLKQQLNDMGIRYDRLKAGITATVSASDTVRIPIPVPTERKDTIHYKFYTRNDSSVVSIGPKYAVKVSRYHVSPTLLVIREAKRRGNGRPHWPFPKSTLLWGSQTSYILTVDLPNANVNELTVINQEQ